MKPTKQLIINNCKLAVFDDLLPFNDSESLVKRFYKASFTKNEIGRPDTAQYTHWAHELDIKQLNNEFFWQATISAVKAMYPNKKWRAYRSYVNYSGHGDTMFSHIDAKTEELTCLWYIVPEWNEDWAGETFFYDQQDEIALACIPKPGRLVIFDGRIKNSGRPPGRNCYHSRFTLAIKLEPLQ